MRTFTTNLEREVDKKIRKIMDANVTIIKKSFEASSVLAEAFNKLVLGVVIAFSDYADNFVNVVKSYSETL